MQNKRITKYLKSKCKKKLVVFYIKDKDIYEYASTINFQKFVKEQLRKELDYAKNESTKNLR